MTIFLFSQFGLFRLFIECTEYKFNISKYYLNIFSKFLSHDWHLSVWLSTLYPQAKYDFLSRYQQTLAAELGSLCNDHYNLIRQMHCTYSQSVTQPAVVIKPLNQSNTSHSLVFLLIILPHSISQHLPTHPAVFSVPGVQGSCVATILSSHLLWNIYFRSYFFLLYLKTCEYNGTYSKVNRKTCSYLIQLWKFLKCLIY